MEKPSDKDKAVYKRFRCPTCNLLLKAPENAIGIKAQCPNCSSIHELTKELIENLNI